MEALNRACTWKVDIEPWHPVDPLAGINILAKYSDPFRDYGVVLLLVVIPAPSPTETWIIVGQALRADDGLPANTGIVDEDILCRHEGLIHKIHQQACTPKYRWAPRDGRIILVDRASPSGPVVGYRSPIRQCEIQSRTGMRQPHASPVTMGVLVGTADA